MAGLLDWIYTTAVSVVSRGKVTASQPGQRGLVQVQLLDDEAKARVEHLLPYGRSALPLGGDALLLTVGGSRDHVVCIGVDDPTRRINDLAPGEFGDSDGASRIIFRGDRLEIGSTREIDIQSDATVYVTAPHVIINTVGGTTYHLLDERAMAVYNAHTHTAPSGGGTTSTPSGTMSLGSQTTTALVSS
jgi:phage gp45-like